MKLLLCLRRLSRPVKLEACFCVMTVIPAFHGTCSKNGIELPLGNRIFSPGIRCNILLCTLFPAPRWDCCNQCHHFWGYQVWVHCIELLVSCRTPSMMVYELQIECTGMEEMCVFTPAGWSKNKSFVNV